MRYLSTRGSALSNGASECFVSGIAGDGGLFVPESFPEISLEEIAALGKLSYSQRCAFILSRYLDDFTSEELNQCVSAAYDGGSFDCAARAPLSRLNGGLYMLELWHGPTLAFKDMALQLLPHLLVTAKRKLNRRETTLILVATSGDTGKAALEGFCDIEGVKIAVFYPEQGVSLMQKLQMTTQEGENVAVCAIHGNFDDAQSAVKSIFTNDEIKAELAKKNMMFSSANSINWGRLVPQIVYYFSAYADLCKMGQLQVGEPMNVVVPTGNFGNILAGYYAKHMGLPIKTMVCASNTNNVLTDFLKTGTYDRNRDFYATTSPSMDILISSNLERLLYHMSGESDAAVRGWMTQLAENGKYTVEPEVMAKIQNEFAAGYCDEAAVADTIHKTYTDQNYLCDTHTAVAVKVYRDYVAQTGDDLPTVIDSTASPYKFSKSVLTAVLEGNTPQLDEFDMVEELHRVTGAAVPAPLAALKDKAVRFTQVCDRENMSQMVFQLLNL